MWVLLACAGEAPAPPPAVDGPVPVELSHQRSYPLSNKAPKDVSAAWVKGKLQVQSTGIKAACDSAPFWDGKRQGNTIVVQAHGTGGSPEPCGYTALVNVDVPRAKLDVLVLGTDGALLKRVEVDERAR